MKVCVVAEYYPREHDPVLGIWAHRQALAARDAGAEVHVVVLHRPIPPLSTPRGELLAAALALLRHPRRRVLDGLRVDYVPFVAPPRPGHYGTWGAWAAPSLAVHLRRLRRRFRFDLVHAHYAIPTGDAVRRAWPRAPLVVSAHGGDGLYDGLQTPNVERAFGAARLVLCNSQGTADRARRAGARRTRVVHLGADLPAELPRKREEVTLVTLAHLVPRKRHTDVLRAMWLLRDRHPRLRWLVIGDGPERAGLESLATRLGLRDRVELAGQLPHPEALQAAYAAHLFVMPSVDEAFGVGYVEAMAGGLPAVGSLGEPGPAEIEEAGDGIRLVPPGDVEALAGAIDRDLSKPPRALRERGEAARRTVERTFTWPKCGRATVAAYEDALARGPVA